ncbi:MAG: hypothetical protein ACKO2H_02755 [Bacteroidota bacterium]|nr:hypothetical protein [bacterium]NBP63065.1 hypothetical protein [Bacteroidota bacterium]
MKHLILIFLVIPVIVTGQVFTLTYEDNTSGDKPSVQFGFIKGATDGIDGMLGEKEIPPLHPFSGAHMVTILDINKDGSFSSLVDMFTYRDFRNTEPMHTADTFWIEVSPWKADKKWMKFSWEYPLGTGIDSMVLTDRGGASLRITCDDKKSHTILPNSFGVGQITIEDFYVIVYRSQGINSIQEDVCTEQKQLSDVYSSTGIILATQLDGHQLTQLMESSPNGLYFIRTGSTITSRIVHR